MKLRTATHLLSLSSISSALQSSINNLNLDICAPNSFRSPFDLSCSLPIEALSEDIHPPNNIHRTSSKPQEVFKSSHSHETNNHGVWSHKPRCLRQYNATQKYCVYTSSTFAEGRGISIFTNANSTLDILSLPAFTDPKVVKGINKEHNRAYKQEEIPGKGLGLVATLPIKRGENIFSTTPVFLLEEGIYDDFVEKDRMPFYHLAVKQLPKPAEKLFNDLMGHFGGDPVEDKINTNCFAVDMFEDIPEKSTPFNAVLPEVSVRPQPPTTPPSQN